MPSSLYAIADTSRSCLDLLIRSGPASIRPHGALAARSIERSRPPGLEREGVAIGSAGRGHRSRRSEAHRGLFLVTSLRGELARKEREKNMTRIVMLATALLVIGSASAT